MSRGNHASLSRIQPDFQKESDSPSIATATSISQVKSALQKLQSRHDIVTNHLDHIIASHAHVVGQLSKLDLSRARLTALSNTTRALSHGQISSAASTASRLSDAVSRLDLEQDRVKATLAVVEQVSELKSCVLGVVGSMGAPQDWETAAQYISRASKIPEHVIHSGFAEDNVPTAEVPDPPALTLDNAAKSLCSLFLKEFEKAVETADGARVTRFFKMFPLIGRSKEGLEAYGRYVCQGVALRARGRLQGVSSRSDGFAYVQALTKLFEHIAHVIDGHTHLVQQHYGTGTMVKVMEKLHAEADVQGGIILDTWNDERAIDRKLTDVKSYAYSFLVQSFVSAPSGRGTPRSQSPAAKGAGGKAAQDQLDDGIEMKEIDQVLNELTAMLGHWSLYLRFMSSRAAESEVDDPETTTLTDLTIPTFLTNCNLPRKVTRTLTDPFKTFATFFLRRSVEKSFQMEEFPSGLSMNPNKPVSTTANAPYITSVVDDVMYMVNQVLQRTLATSQASVVTNIVSSIGRVLGSDFIGMIQRKMRDENYPKAAIQGAMPPEDKVISFLVLANNLDIATDYITRIITPHTSQSPDKKQMNGTSHHHSNSSGSARPLTDLFPLNADAKAVHTALTNLSHSFTTKATDLIEDALSVAFSQILKPRLRAYLSDLFRDVEYSTAEDPQPNGSTSPNETSTFSSRAQRGYDALTRPVKRILSPKNAERIMNTTIAYVANLLEKRIWSHAGKLSEFGAVRLERDVADVVAVVVKGEAFAVREVFARCLQVCSVVNMDEEEWEEVVLAEEEGNEDGGGDGVEGGKAVDEMWILSATERRKARGLVKGRE